ncbi:L-lactate permease [Hyaloraphidium curvatum]|nr:L-lactate permease [Hyaloraphidium curvatum]
MSGNYDPNVPNQGPWGPAGAVILSVLPIIFLLVVTLVPQISLKSTISLPVAALIMFCVRSAYFAAPGNLVAGCVISGFLDCLTPITVIGGAMFLFETMTQSGAMDWIIWQLKKLSKGHPIAEIMILGYCFNALIEGASGFGTPVMLASPILRELGHDGVAAVIACLLFNSCLTIFGAAGTPVWFGFSGNGFSEEQLREIGFRSQIGMTSSAFFAGVPIISLLPLVKWADIRRNLLYIYLAVLSVQAPAMGLSYISYELPTLLGGVIGLGITAVLTAYKVGLKPVAKKADLENGSDTTRGSIVSEASAASPISPVSEPAHESPVTSTLDHKAGDLPPNGDVPPPATADRVPTYSTTKSAIEELEEMEALPDAQDEPARYAINFGNAVANTAPLIFTIVFLILSRIPQIGLRGLLTRTSPSFTMYLGTLFNLSISASLVFAFQYILGSPYVSSTYQVLFVPAWLPFAVGATLGSFYLAWWRASRNQTAGEPAKSWPRNALDQLNRSARVTLGRLVGPFIALIGANILVALLRTGGKPSPAYMLGSTLAFYMGKGWLAIAMLLGVIGTFFSGSTTISNLTFAPVQAAAAEESGLGTIALMALNNCGASLGNIVAIGNVVAAKAVMGDTVNSEGVYIRKTFQLLPSFLLVSTLALLGFALTEPALPVYVPPQVDVATSSVVY